MKVLRLLLILFLFSSYLYGMDQACEGIEPILLVDQYGIPIPTEEIPEIDNLKLFDHLIKQICSKLPPEMLKYVLVAFDFDSTLVTFKKPWMYGDYYTDAFCPSFDEYLLRYFYIDRYKFKSEILAQEEYCLCEKQYPRIINSLQKLGVKTLCLTGTIHGRYGLFEHFEDHKILMLKEKFKIDFGQTFNGWDFLSQELDESDENPLYKEGFLFTEDKDFALCIFLNLIRLKTSVDIAGEWNPVIIISIDDDLDNLKMERSAVMIYAKKMGLNISFFAFHYCGYKRCYDASKIEQHKAAAMHDISLYLTRKQYNANVVDIPCSNNCAIV